MSKKPRYLEAIEGISAWLSVSPDVLRQRMARARAQILNPNCLESHEIESDRPLPPVRQAHLDQCSLCQAIIGAGRA